MSSLMPASRENRPAPAARSQAQAPANKERDAFVEGYCSGHEAGRNKMAQEALPVLRWADQALREREKAEQALRAQQERFDAILGRVALLGFGRGVSLAQRATCLAVVVGQLAKEATQPGSGAAPARERVLKRKRDDLGVPDAAPETAQDQQAAATLVGLGAPAQVLPARAAAAAPPPAEETFKKTVLVQLLAFAHAGELRATKPTKIDPWLRARTRWAEAPGTLYKQWSGRLAEHFGVAVQDLPETITWYRKTLSRL